MPSSFKVITDPSEIFRLNKALGTRLNSTFKRKESRDIAYPAGTFDSEVHFDKGSGTAVRAWAPVVQEKRLLNFILFAEPGVTSPIEIAVQLNFPAKEYSRKLAGAFVADAEGKIFIAHRGRLTKGRAALKQRDVFREFSANLIDADDNEQVSQLILVSGLDAPNLADRLWLFATEAREVATRLDEQRRPRSNSNTTGSAATPKSQGSNATLPPTSSPDRLIVLRTYFDEFAGTTDVKGHSSGQRTVEHGDIVKALETHQSSTGLTQKAQAIDLAVVLTNEVRLFEVKTSAKTTSVYTGVGQLLIHGESIAERLKLSVQRYLVLPAPPNSEHARHISKKGQMKIITYRKSESGYQFEGI
ncbi:MAG: hypothetical protein KGO02_06365 [Alphaproteobacteria bacterium]|nr:hypothetical protein [Alphaproteobacteria bacterium]